jgi:tetratricopeptide (TPR) repeat protein
MPGEEPQNDDDRKWNADQPEQDGAHGVPLLRIVGPGTSLDSARFHDLDKVLRVARRRDPSPGQTTITVARGLRCLWELTHYFVPLMFLSSPLKVTGMRGTPKSQIFRELLKTLREDPLRHLELTNERIRTDPACADAYYSRHFAWIRLGEPVRAFEDLDRAAELTPDQATFLLRGRLYRQLGEYRKAIDDFNRAEAINPARWEADAMGLYYQADCHARLGDESQALACCMRLPDDFWTPGLRGAPPVNRLQIADELRRMSDAAKRLSKQETASK